MIFQSNDMENFMESYNDMNDLNLQAYNEVYFGDKPIIPLQKAFSEFRKNWIGKPYSIKINYDNNLLKFNRLVEEQFGYYRFALTIDPDMSLNAYMLNVQLYSNTSPKDFGKDLVVKSGMGFRYAKDSGVTAMATVLYGLLQSDKYSDRELIAILLHEIGHSFTYAVLNQDGSLLNRARFFINRIMSNMIKKNITEERDFSEEKIKKDIDEQSGILDKLWGFASKVKSINPIKIFSAVTNPNMKGNKRYLGYTDEKFADTFASMYGYSTELNGALQRMTQDAYDKYLPKRTPSTIEIVYEIINRNIDDIILTELNLKDEHPEGLTRIKVQIEYLERELAKQGIDPKLKLELQAQLNYQRQLIDEYINYSADVDGAKALRTYYTLMYNKYGGDRREKKTNNEAIFKTIDDVYDKLK